MNTFTEKSFILNNSLAAVSAATNGNSLIATDGLECRLHFFDQNGSFDRCCATLRPYRRLRYDCESESYTALGCCGTARIYFLDGSFNEQCYLELDTSNGCDCGCDCGCGEFFELTDASLTEIGGEKFIIGVFRGGAYLFDMNGRRLSRLCEADSDEILTDFISPAPELYAMATLRGCTQTVTVSDNGIIHSAILERGHVLRMLQSDGNGQISALFGRNYIYNRVLPIYSNGVLTLPSAKGCF